MIIMQRNIWIIRPATFLLVAASFHIGTAYAQALVPSITATPSQTRLQEDNRRRTMAKRRRVQEGIDQRQEAAMIDVNAALVAPDVTVRQHHRLQSMHHDSTAAGRPAAPRTAGTMDPGSS